MSLLRRAGRSTVGADNTFCVPGPGRVGGQFGSRQRFWPKWAAGSFLVWYARGPIRRDVCRLTE